MTIRRIWNFWKSSAQPTSPASLSKDPVTFHRLRPGRQFDMRPWIKLVEQLLEKKHHHHHKQHSNTVRYGFFPRLGIYSCGHCGTKSSISDSTAHCPSCGTS